MLIWLLLGTAALCVLLTLLLLLPICYALAGFGRLFTFVQEGTGRIIVRGKSFDHAVMSYHGYHLNDPRKRWYHPDLPAWEVLSDAWKDFPDKGKGSSRDLANLYDDREWLLKFLGIYWIGLPPAKVLWYKFEWAELQLKKEGEEKVWPRAEPTNFVYISDFTYLAKVGQLKTADNLEVEIEYNRTVRVNNPYKALYRTAEWLKRIGAATDREAKDFVGHYGYKELQSNLKAKGKGEEAGEQKKPSFSDSMLELNENLPDDAPSTLKGEKGFTGRYGVTLVASDFRRVELAGGAEGVANKAAIRAYTAEQEAKAIRIEGKAKADVVEMQGNAEAESLKARLAVIQEAGAAGLAVAQFDSIVEASKNPAALIIEANNMGGATAGAVLNAAAKLAQGPKPAPTQPKTSTGGTP